MSDNTVKIPLHLAVNNEQRLWYTKFSSQYFIKSGQLNLNTNQLKTVNEILKVHNLLEKMRRMPQTASTTFRMEIRAFQEFFMRDLYHYIFTDISIKDDEDSDGPDGYVSLKFPLATDDIVFEEENTIYTFKISINARHQQIAEMFKLLSFDYRKLSNNNKIMIGVMIEQMSEFLHTLILKCEIRAKDYEPIQK